MPVTKYAHVSKGENHKHCDSSIDSLTTTYGFHQLSDPTHLLLNFSCIDLIFTDQPNLVLDSGVHPTLHGNCHHQIIFSKFNLMVEYPPLYERLVWDNRKANIDSIQKALTQINWMFLFSNKSVHQQVKIIKIFFNDKDPPWMSEHLKKKIKWHNTGFPQSWKILESPGI